MIYEDKLQNVSVLGAAGRMGRDILLLTAMEMAFQKLKPANKKRDFVVNAMDVDDKALHELMDYIHDQAVKFAEKGIVYLRKVYARHHHLIDNEEIILQFSRDVLQVIRPCNRLEPTFDSTVVFESVSEKPELKLELLVNIQKNNKNNPWFFSNTSAIPIDYLDREAGLEGNIMGLHFYYPPAVNKMVEVIKTGNTRPELSYFLKDFLKNVRKVAIPAYDVPGFIGSGFMMRDILHAEGEVNKLQQEVSFIEAIYIMNIVSQDFLIRPMGVFQRVDYLGIDVVHFAMSVMRPHIENELIHSPLIDKYVEHGVRGGLNDDGTQKDGIFSYKKRKIQGIYDPGKKRYIPIKEIEAACHTYTGKLPSSWLPWNKVKTSLDKEELLRNYFMELKALQGNGSLLAQNYLDRFRQIGKTLVKDKVAFRFEDVNAVMEYGFQQAYGPVNDLF